MTEEEIETLKNDMGFIEFHETLEEARLDDEKYWEFIEAMYEECVNI